MKFFILFLCSVFSFQLSAQPISEIVNGIEVPATDPIAKSTVMLTMKYQRFSTTCTGTIYAKDLIVTAAHCLGPYGAGTMTVFFGINKNQSGITFKVSKQIWPETYSTTPEKDWDDIALLLLEKPIPAGYQVAELLADSAELQTGTSAILAGYGINVPTSPNNGDGGLGILRAVEQNMIAPEYGHAEVLISIKGKGTCSGDSGGPGFLKKDGKLFLFGAASHMTEKDLIPGSKPPRYECREEIVYTNLLKQMQWLKTAEAELRKQ